MRGQGRDLESAMANSTSRTSSTHRSQLARRLDLETGMGYQRALTTVREQADSLVQQLRLERLDASALDMMLRGLLHQGIEFWGPGIGAHRWPDSYYAHLLMGLPAAMGDAAMDAGDRAARSHPDQARPCGTFDPSWLAAEGIAPTVDDAPDEDDEADDHDTVEPAVDEPDRWKRFVLAQGERDAFALPAQQLMSPALITELDGLDPDHARLLLEQLTVEQPLLVDAFVRRAELALADHGDFDGSGEDLPDTALQEARTWYECAVAVGEQSLNFFHGKLPWSEPTNRPFLRALFGLASMAAVQERLNTSEQIIFALLALDPRDALNAGQLLVDVRRRAGLPQP